MKCEAYSLPSYYFPESKRCSKPNPNGVSVVHEGKNKRVCWAHVKEYQNKGGDIFKPRLPAPARIK
jgi:hypothetical protein